MSIKSFPMSTPMSMEACVGEMQKKMVGYFIGMALLLVPNVQEKGGRNEKMEDVEGEQE